MRKHYYLFIISILSIFLLNANIVFAQFEDDEFDLEKEEVVCAPESLDTVYDGYDFTEVTFDNIRQWYSFGSEYYKNKNYKSALPYLWKVFINEFSLFNYPYL